MCINQWKSMIAVESCGYACEEDNTGSNFCVSACVSVYKSVNSLRLSSKLTPRSSKWGWFLVETIELRTNSPAI